MSGQNAIGQTIGDYDPSIRYVAPIISKEHLKEVFRDIAPLYEAENVLKEWLQTNGIVYGTDGYSYRVKDMRPATRGANIDRTFTTYGEMLVFALQWVKDNIVAQAIQDMKDSSNDQHHLNHLTEYRQDG